MVVLSGQRMSKVIVGSVRSFANGYFSRDEMNVMINRHWLNNDHAGVYNEVTDKIDLVDHPDVSKVVEAQKRLCTSFSVHIVADVFSDGTIGNYRIEEIPKSSSVLD